MKNLYTATLERRKDLSAAAFSSWVGPSETFELQDDPGQDLLSPSQGGKREAKPTAESKDARAARVRVKACEKALWRLRLGRVEPPFNCGICHHPSRRGMGLSCA